MISIINNSLKTRKKICEIPINKVCLNTLKFLRAQNFINGFQIISPGVKTQRLYPRVRILLKFANIFDSVITSMKPCKNTRSNFHIIKRDMKIQNEGHKKFLITTNEGLTLLNIADIYKSRKKIKGKKLMEITF